MNPSTESLNGKYPRTESKTIMGEAFESATHLADQVKMKATDAQKQAQNYIAVTDAYAKKHPWRMALTAAGIGVIFGALYFRRRN